MADFLPGSAPYYSLLHGTDVEAVCCVYMAWYTQGTLDCTQQQFVGSKGGPVRKSKRATKEMVRNLQIYITLFPVYLLLV
jgi:hypothetical protein